MTFRHEASANDSQFFTLRNFAIFLGALLAVWFWLVIFGGETFVYRDFGYFGFPLAAHHRTAFWTGEVPLWNPLNHCGIPFLAQWNTMTLYPGTLIYLLLPSDAALGWFDLVHLWLAGVGMFLLARAWYENGFAAAVAGLGFAVSGLALNFLLWPNNVAALAWMPFVIWLGLGSPSPRPSPYPMRRESGFAAAVLVGAMQMLTGAPEVILLTWAILFVLVAVKCFQERSAAAGKYFLGIGFVVTCLCAAQLLPFLDLTRISQRHRDFGGEFWAMPLWGWASFFVPLVYTYTLSSGVRFQYDQLWTSSYYPSIAITLLALMGLVAWRKRTAREKALYAITFVALLLALGPAGHVYTIAKAIVPGLGLIRFPVKFVMVTAFTLPLLAAGSIGTLDDRARKNVWRVVALLTLLILAYAKTHPKFGPEFNDIKLTFRSGAVTLLFATLAVVCLAGVRVRKFQLALLLLIPLDVYFHAPNPAPTIARSAFSPSDEKSSGRAMLSRQTFETLYNETISDTFTNFVLNRKVLNANLNLIDGDAKVDGFFSLNTEWSERLRNQVYAKGQGNLDAIMDFMGVTRVTGTNDIFAWIPRANAMGLATAGQSPRFLDETNCLYALFDPRFIPRDKVVFSEQMEGYDAGRVEATVTNLARTDHSISFDVNAAKPTFAVVAESFHPNWRATINGRPARILRANYAFQAVAIPAGASRVEFKYVDRAFQIGLGISLLTLASLLGVTLFRHE